MSDTTREKWDRVYQDRDHSEQDVPAMRVVADNLHLVPSQGNGLELACGLAANSFLLAENGIDMDAWDISPVAAERVNQMAQQRGVNVRAIARDLVAQPLTAIEEYDVIVISHFLERTAVPAIISALKPGGLVFYQTFTQTRVSQNGPSKNEWRLADGELLSLFAGLRLLVYREEGLVGDVHRGLRNEALLVAQKVTGSN